MGKFCKECGSSLENDVCPNCGVKSEKKSKGGGKAVVIVIAAIIGAGVLAVVGFITLIIIIAIFIPDKYKVVETDGDCKYVHAFDMNDEQIYLYCLNKVDVYINKSEKYKSLEDYYKSNNNATDIIIKSLELKNKKDNGVEIYKYYSDFDLIKCPNNRIVYAKSKTEYKDEYCGIENQVKEDENKQDNEVNSEVKPNTNNNKTSQPKTNTNNNSTNATNNTNSNNATSTQNNGDSSITNGQKQALRSAKTYISIMSFSRDGLIKQLEFEGFTQEESEYGADNCGADWNAQAIKSAKNYLDTMAFSRSGLIKQLKFEGFTQEQAEYGVNNSGADWNAQAVKSARNYLDIMAFSHDSLVNQLKFEGFTQEQAEYGVSQNGL